MVEVVHASGGVLVCCGQPMTNLAEKTAVLEGKEKHVPVIERQNGGYLVKVGATAHPMLEEHYIEWIELIVDDKVCRAELKPGDEPEAFFAVAEAKNVSAREYCSVHGLWKI